MTLTTKIISGIAATLLLGTALSSWYTIGQGQRGVITTMGAVTGESPPGLHFKFPWIQGVNYISIQPQKIAFDSKESELEAYSKDQQPATVRLSVNYHVNNATALYSGYGYIENYESRILGPRILEQFKNVFGHYNAVEAIQDRSKLNIEAMMALQTSIIGPITIDSLQIEDITFSDAYEKAVEARMAATVKQQQAEAEKAQRITNADAAAYEVKAQADAQAHATEVQGNAQAQAIKARGDALRSNPDLVSLTTAEKWDGKLPITMIPGGSVPFLDMKGLGK